MGSSKNYIKFNTNQEKIDKIPGKPRILIAPLDWGLGHATRCIPIIHEFIEQHCEVWLAGDGAIKNLLTAEFPDLPFLTLPGYRIRYSKSIFGFAGNIMLQIPRILHTIYSENRWLKKKQKQYQFDAVIADNRYGMHHPSISSVFITHQLQIRTNLGRWSDMILRKANYRYVNRFNACWVPDHGGQRNLGGELSHPRQLPAIPVSYVGLLSRFKQVSVQERKRHLLIMLSGPEPARSEFEDVLINQLVHYNGTADFVRGLPSVETILPSTNQLRFYNHLSTEELNKKMAAAEIIISRTGYSSVMDIVQLQKKSILIPTRGQSEQEYLGEYLVANKIAYCVKQVDFSLQKDLDAAQHFSYRIPISEEGKLKTTIRQLIAKLTSLEI